MNGQSVRQVAPLVLDSVSHAIKEKRTVQEALVGHAWIRDVRGFLSNEAVAQCVFLLYCVANVERDPSVSGQFRWTCSASGTYMAKETYKALCQGATRFQGASNIWRNWVPLKCKIFVWLAI